MIILALPLLPTAITHHGRRYGSFQLLLRVPDAYLCKWSSCVVQNGVLRIRYPKDEDEVDVEVEG